jgi:hypothetical protein
MVLFDLLKMTKTKLILLIIFLVMLIPSYFDLSCISGYCAAGKEVCTCGFLPVEFFVTFTWMYVFACAIVEFAELIKKRIK